jgi:hypothetical protein
MTLATKRLHHRFGELPLEESTLMSGTDDVKGVQGDGYTDNYFGGQNGEPDGPGHGHIRVNEEGETSIVRGAYTPGEPFARANALEQDSRGRHGGS